MPESSVQDGKRVSEGVLLKCGERDELPSMALDSGIPAGMTFLANQDVFWGCYLEMILIFHSRLLLSWIRAFSFWIGRLGLLLALRLSDEVRRVSFGGSCHPPRRKCRMTMSPVRAAALFMPGGGTGGAVRSIQ
jgi:hypothetical protein